MMHLQRSTSSKPNEDFVEAKRAVATVKRAGAKKGDRMQDNVAWCQAQPDHDGGHLLLLGGTDTISLRIRIAQSHARSTLTPGNWSHVALMPGKLYKNAGKTPLFHVPVAGSATSQAIDNNGVVEARLEDFADRKAYPNIALIRLPVAQSELRAAIKTFSHDRGLIDALDLVVTWLAFSWGVGASPNPLLHEVGVPSAVFAEHVVGSSGFELTPGLASRSSCPEAIWQSARYWYKFHTQATEQGERLSGTWNLEHYMDGVLRVAPGS
ncbi:hypothetical protein [Engelhardtia mirabilis]|uniref:Uncharacterized protein n=1 Tax=Engelhardtia mirabilis TaxID=2528011 RepID=A0A518BEL1_9BACT|nr:hypothetical protein Pla133_04610 [Planctomycetes bacterium Pla133]QDU99722.1 hypothetical protein Pla86_04610 [Planctomycetes bacterium Pla86]